MLFADLFILNLNIASGFFILNIDIGKGRAFSDFLAITGSLARYTITYNLLDLLLILGIWIFITFVPLTWNQDFKVPTTHVPLITSFIGAVLSIMVVHFFKGIFRRRETPARA